MKNLVNVLAPALGGTALVLGLAYGVTSRDYRSGELQRAQEQAIASAAHADRATAKLLDLQTQLAAAKAEADTHAKEIEKLKEQLAAGGGAGDPAVLPVSADPAVADPVTDDKKVVAGIGDAERGKKIFAKCSGCHQIGPDATNRAGPHLNGIFQRKAGIIDGFRYSKAMERASNDGLIWDLEHLDAYIENPKALVTGTRMSFRGISDPQDRHDLLAYLRDFSENPQDIPEAAPTAIKREVELPPEILAIVGDRAYGEYLASECLTCHKKDGSDDGIPSITYWPEEDFVIAMHAYKRKLRPHPVMQLMAGRLSDEEIAALATYFKTID